MDNTNKTIATAALAVLGAVLTLAFSAFLVMITWGAIAGYHDWQTIGFFESVLWVFFASLVGGNFNLSRSVKK